MNQQMANCPHCNHLEQELTRCREKITEFEAWKKQYQVWKEKYQFRRGLVIGILLLMLAANIISLASRF